jgi:PAS domain S-box-containing protein/diguanylate cyclase (GGDEF)-like protein
MSGLFASNPRLLPRLIKYLAIMMMIAVPGLLIFNLYLDQHGAEFGGSHDLADRRFVITMLVAATCLMACMLLWLETSQRQRAENVAEEHILELQRNALIAANSDVMVAITAADGRIEWINAALTRLTGYQLADVRGRRPVDMLAGPRSGQQTLQQLDQAMQQQRNLGLELTAYTRDGREYWCELQLQPLLNKIGSLTGFVLLLHDTTLRKQQQQQLEKIAYYDSLTGLANREMLLQQLRRSLQAENERPAVIYVKFPRAAALRGSLGHDMSDELTLAIVSRLKEAMLPEQLLARLSASVFVIMAPVKRPAQAMTVAYTMQSMLSKPYRVADREIHLVSSIGVSVAASDTLDPEALLRDAEIAVQSVSTRSMDEVVLFDISMRQDLEQRHMLESDLRRAIYFDSDQLCCAFQPIMDLTNLQLVGFETLARWKHPERGWIPPDKFIAIAEETGMIVPLWNFVFTEACRALIKWQQLRGTRQPSLFISINLSATQFFYPGLIRSLSNVIEMTQINPTWLKFEITESGLMENAEAALHQMESIKALGCSLSIDDFGTGYSSLSYLQKLPVDDIKIDRSFILAMHKGPENREIVRIITELGRILGKKVIAEGIETEQDLRVLQSLRCDMGQGYYFHKPLLGDAAEALVTELTRQAVRNPQEA